MHVIDVEYEGSINPFYSAYETYNNRRAIVHIYSIQHLAVCL